MRPTVRLWVVALLSVLGTVAGGALECSPAAQAHAQHHGAEIYGRMCAVCHGSQGEGYKADQAPAVGRSEYLATADEAYLRRAIEEGRGGTTMSAWGIRYGGPLKTPDVDAVIAHLRTLQRSDMARLDDTPPHGQSQRGGTLYARECAKCHGARGTGGPYVGIGGAQLLGSASDGFLRYAIVHGRPGTSMPPFEAILDGAAIDDVLSLLREWQKTPQLAQRAAPAKPPPIPLGPVPLNPHGPEPVGFQTQPGTTKTEVVKRELDRGARMALLDARAPSDYANEHIAGAVSVPFYDPDQYLPNLPRDAWLVAYCSCPHAESGTLASKLAAAGFKKVTVLDEGLGFWKRQGFATHSGIDP